MLFPTGASACQAGGETACCQRAQRENQEPQPAVPESRMKETGHQPRTVESHPRSEREVTVSPHTTSTQHLAGDACQCNKTRIRNERHKEGKGRHCTAHRQYAVYTENPKQLTNNCQNSSTNLTRWQDTRLTCKKPLYFYIPAIST